MTAPPAATAAIASTATAAATGCTATRAVTAFYGGSGNDRMNTASNRRRGDYVSGGSGRDWAKVNRGDRVKSVERRSR